MSKFEPNTDPLPNSQQLCIFKVGYTMKLIDTASEIEIMQREAEFLVELWDCEFVSWQNAAPSNTFNLGRQEIVLYTSFNEILNSY